MDFTHSSGTGTCPAVLGIDAGTHGIRILALRTSDAGVICTSQAPYERHVRNGIQELDAEAVRSAFEEALLNLPLPDHAAVCALGITHQRGTVLPVKDENGFPVPLHPALCDSDERAASGSEYRAMGIDPDRYYRESGCPVVSFNGFSKILWMKAHEQSLFAQTDAWLSIQDYLLSLLSGRILNTEGSLLRNGLLDIHTRKPHAGHLNAAGLKIGSFTGVGEDCGSVSAEMALKFPFLEKARLIAVPGDQPAAYWGAAEGVPDIAAMNLGTTFVVSIASGKPLFSADGLITTEVLPDGLYSPEFGTGAGGQFMDFLKSILAPEKENAQFWQEMNFLSGKIPAGADGLKIVPLLWQVTSGGVEGCIRGLLPHHTPAHFVRAAYEGLAFEAALSVRKVFKAAAEDDRSFVRPDVLRVFGGLSASRVFLQILASVLGMKVCKAGQMQSSAYGAGLVCINSLAGTLHSAGRKTDAGTSKTAVPSEVFLPDKTEEAYYERAFEQYAKIR